MRLKPIAALVLLLTAAPAHAAVPGIGSWDPIAQRMVREAGVMPALVSGGFGGAQRLDGTQLGEAFAALSVRLGVAPVAVPAGHISVTRFDRAMVNQLGLSDVARPSRPRPSAPACTRPPTSAPRRSRASSGCASPSRTAARPWSCTRGQITRAEAAWSFAKVAAFDGSQQAYDRQVFMQYQLTGVTAASASRCAWR